MKARVHVWVSGRVQGVYFRYKTLEEARRYGVTGWVRNLIDGRVEAVFQGDEAAVTHMIMFCREGPAYARVDHVQVRPEEYDCEFCGFEIWY